MRVVDLDWHYVNELSHHSGIIWAESNDEGVVFKTLLPQKQEVKSLVNN
jgi:hypothetical protein